MIQAFNLTPRSQMLALRFPAMSPIGAWVCSPIEEDQDELPIAGDAITLSLLPRSIACARVTLE